MIRFLHEKYECSGCSACVNICPVNAICMESDSEGFLYPHIDDKSCVNCHLCNKVCSALNREKCIGNECDAFAAYTKNQYTHINSSSGGIFAEIAQLIIENRGVVFGAAFSEGYTVRHIMVDSVDNLKLLQGSKYLQSDMRDTYAQVKKMLDTERWVLFTGTPCQVEGLRNFLKRDYNQLITQDIVCHGVPSPLVWKKYIEWKEANAHSTVSSVNFREKNFGWKKFSLCVALSNGTEYRRKFNEDLFMKGFLSNIYLRPSCYQCRFRSVHRISDFTLADFWGIQHVCPEMEHPDGTSLIWLNSDKAKAIWGEVKEKLIYKKVDLNEAIRYNTAAVSSIQLPMVRTRFFELFQSKPIDVAISAVLPKENAFKKLARKMKKLLKTYLKTLIQSVMA